MSAIIIPFPRRVEPQLPGHWSGQDHSHFVHLTYDGTYSREEAIEYVECLRRFRDDSPGIQQAAIKAAETVKRRNP